MKTPRMGLLNVPLSMTMPPFATPLSERFQAKLCRIHQTYPELVPPFPLVARRTGTKNSSSSHRVS